MSKAPLRVVWPWLDYVCCCFINRKKKRFDISLKRSIRNRLNLDYSKSDQILDEDPYLMLGFGINSYFEIITQLMCMFAIITVIFVPIAWQNSQFGALEQYPSYLTT